jgi:hypothetical protein
MAGPVPSVLSRPFKNRAAPWIVLTIGLALSVSMWFSARRELKRQDATRFDQLKERLITVIDARFQAAEQAIYGGRALVESTGDLACAMGAVRGFRLAVL